MSVKQRLISALQRELDSLPRGQRSASEQAHMLWELGQRGSGPLPYHLKQAARRRGLIPSVTAQLDASGGESDTWEQRCPYCLGEHNRPRARYCCPEHARRAANERQREQRRIARTFAKIDRRVKDRATRRHQWREIAAGRNQDTHVAAIFGATPDLATHVPEWDGDPT